jgi:hypothetical protein
MMVVVVPSAVAPIPSIAIASVTVIGMDNVMDDVEELSFGTLKRPFNGDRVSDL